MCCFYPTMLNGLFAIWSPVFLPKVPQAMLQIRPPWVVHFAPEQLVHIAPDLLVHFSPEYLVNFTADYSILSGRTGRGHQHRRMSVIRPKRASS